MYVLIKQNSENVIESVQKIDRDGHGVIFENEAIQKADDLIRAELAEWEYFGDIDFEDNSVPGNLLTCVAMWAIDDATWMLYQL